jgi:hypothetical protein
VELALHVAARSIRQVDACPRWPASKVRNLSVGRDDGYAMAQGGFE